MGRRVVRRAQGLASVVGEANRRHLRNARSNGWDGGQHALVAARLGRLCLGARAVGSLGPRSSNNSRRLGLGRLEQCAPARLGLGVRLRGGRRLGSAFLDSAAVPPTGGSPSASAGATGWNDATRLALHALHRTVQCPCSANFWTRHGVIVSSLLHSREKLGAGGVLEAGGSGTGNAIEPMT